MQALKLLLVDDDQKSLKLLSAIFESEGYETICTADGQDAFDVLLTKGKVDAVITDILMPNVDGYFLSYKIRTNTNLKNIPIIIYSGTFMQDDEEKIAEQMGADAFLRKPTPRLELLSVVKNLIAQPENRKSPSEAISFEIFRKYNSEVIQKLELRNKELEEAKESLEKIVLERTRELDITNKELSAANEELRAANEELTNLNDQLLAASEHIKQQSQIIIDQQAEAIKRSEQSQEIIFNNTHEEILVADSSGKLIFFNRSLAHFITRTTGKRPKLGMFLWDITIPERREVEHGLFQRAMNGEAFEVEARFCLKGNEFIHMLRYSPVSVNGSIQCVALISTDVTEKIQQDIQLKKSEASLRAIFNNTVDGFTMLDRDLNILAFNENNARDVLELTGNRLAVGGSVFNILPAAYDEAFSKLIDKVNAGEDVKLVIKHKVEDVRKWLEVSIKPVTDNRNNIVGYCITSHDTTEIKKAEAQIIRLNKSLLNFQNAIHRSSIVSIADKAGNIIFVNDNFVRISGFEREELIGKNHRIVNSKHHSKTFWTNMWATISAGNIWRDRVKNKAKNGSYYWVDTFIMPFIDETGNLTQYLSIRNDITHHKLAEEELSQKRILAEEAAKVSKLGYWVRDKASGELTVSREMLAILGVTEDEFLRDNNSLYRNIHRDDYAALPKITESTATSGLIDRIEYRIELGNVTRWIYQREESVRKIGDNEKLIGTIQDITERKTIEEVLRQYNERYEILSKATNDTIWDLDLRLNIIIWNHGITEMFGYEENAFLHDVHWWERQIHPGDKKRVMEELQLAIETKSSRWNSTFRFECADGTYKHCYHRSSIVYDGGVPIRVIGAIQDITERVRATEEIEKLSLVASRTNNAVMITDRQGLIEWVNESFTNLTGYSLAEVKGKKSSFLQGAETDKLTIERISQKLKSQEIISEEIINYSKNGNKFWLKVDIAPVFDEHGEVKNFISVQTDITTLKEFENSIIAIARELSSLIENANVPIFGTDAFGMINEWNRVTEELTGFSKHEAIGTSLADLLTKDDFEKFTSLIECGLQDGTCINVELPVTTKSGKKLSFLTSATPRRTNDTEITGVIFVSQNITELIDYRKNLERKVQERTVELNAALDKEKELVKMKTQFVSIASHEFRTPLSSIAIAAGFIRKYKAKLTEETIEEKLINIEKQVNNMTYLLDDILTVGKGEAGKIPVNLKPLKLPEFIKALVREVSRAVGNTHEIVLQEDYRSYEIVSDEKLLRNIFINFLTNAIKFSPEANKVDMSISTTHDRMKVTIRDYGIGIPQEDLSNLFQPFYRAGNAQAIQGTGLGLSIIKKAIDLLGGSIDVESNVGSGTEMRMQLPI